MYLLDNFKQNLISTLLSAKDPRLLAHYQYLIHISTTLEKSKDPVKIPSPPLCHREHLSDAAAWITFIMVWMNNH
jgi:hypothetical protein